MIRLSVEETFREEDERHTTERFLNPVFLKRFFKYFFLACPFFTNLGFRCCNDVYRSSYSDQG